MKQVTRIQPYPVCTTILERYSQNPALDDDPDFLEDDVESVSNKPREIGRINTGGIVGGTVKNSESR